MKNHNLVRCKICGRKTKTTDVKICNICNMIIDYIKHPHADSDSDKEYIYKLEVKFNSELVDKIKKLVKEKKI